ncbi:hypothetical protein OK351_00105 [Glutamicibacter sp. MNS18]|uniref:hypothetical protein n=1 Tax=Glutamicibacter sp. MNS18 TaxID=2989817 RepID=UPI0022365459|nr:hypothetical protein [Glutamicibacter sp. MNS18]MCW4463917.1 hypothetical protein [Glutamicibacter sp. MNS18]
MSYIGNIEYQRLYFEGVAASQEVATTVGGLVTIDDEGFLSVNVATMYGPISVEVQVIDKSPGSLDPSWADVTEVSATKVEGIVARLVNGSGDELQQPEVIFGSGTSGVFRLRLHRKGEGFAEGRAPTGPGDPRMESLLIGTQRCCL